MPYQEFLARKLRSNPDLGIVTKAKAADWLYPFQRRVVDWALKKGRACIFADCGLGKTFMTLAWAQELGKRALIVAPLCVSHQTIVEGEKVGVPVRYASNETEAQADGISITNYERVGKFNMAQWDAVVLDESSILKAFDGKTRTKLISMCANVPYRLCCTATPSPNDISELGNHAQFLGLMSMAEFLATWFVHDSDGWRMKRHAVQPFFKWMASWALAFRMPSDIGFPDDGFVLPELHIRDAIVASDAASDALFPELGMHGIGGRLRARRGSTLARTEKVVELTAHNDSALVWCGLNAESDLASHQIVGAVNVQGKNTIDEKVSSVFGFIHGDHRVMVSKPKVLGFGMNFQHCAHMVFSGLSDSYESYYQCIRRCWRYGQKRDVTVDVVVSEQERLVVENVRRKQRDAELLTSGLLEHIREFEAEELIA